MREPRYPLNYSQDIVLLQTKYSLFKRVLNILFSVKVDGGFDFAVAFDVQTVDRLCALARAVHDAVQSHLPYVHCDNAVQVTRRTAEVIVGNEGTVQEGHAVIHRRLCISDKAACSCHTVVGRMRFHHAGIGKINDHIIDDAVVLVAHRAAPPP